MCEPRDSTPGEPVVSAAHEPSARAIDLPTIAAIAIVAYVTTVFLHEAVGHGGAAILVGARIVQLTTVDLRYEGEGLTSWDHRMIAAAGSVANLLAGVAALCLLRGAQPASATIRYFRWLFGHVNLFTAGGYPMALAFSGFGDWDALTRGLPHRTAWRVGVTLLGAVISFATLAHAVRSLDPFLGRSEPLRWRRALALTLVSYLAGGTINTVAGLFNPQGMHLVALSAMASTFGGTAFLAWLPKFVDSPRAGPPEPPVNLLRSPRWIAAALIAIAIDVFVVAPGVPR